jgi:hypothetical protein
MQPLRLVDEQGKYVPTDRLPFPTEAVRQMARARIQSLATRVNSPSLGFPMHKPDAAPTDEGLMALEAQLDAALDKAQAQIDSLRQQADRLPFPHFDNSDNDDRPRAA